MPLATTVRVRGTWQLWIAIEFARVSISQRIQAADFVAACRHHIGVISVSTWESVGAPFALPHWRAAARWATWLRSGKASVPLVPPRCQLQLAADGRVSII